MIVLRRKNHLLPYSIYKNGINECKDVYLIKEAFNQMEWNLKLSKIFLFVNTMYFHSRSVKTPVGCIVGLHSGMVLPFTVVVVQPFWCMWCGVLKFFFLGKIFIDPLPHNCGNSFRIWLWHIPKAQIRKDKKLPDLKKCARNPNTQALCLLSHLWLTVLTDWIWQHLWYFGYICGSSQ